MPKSKSKGSSSSSIKDMTNQANEVSVMDVNNMTAVFLQVLDNENVIAKFAQILSASIQLILDEKLTQLNKKLDKVMQDNKVVTDKVSEIEKENNKLKQVNTKLYFRTKIS